MMRLPSWQSNWRILIHEISLEPMTLAWLLAAIATTGAAPPHLHPAATAYKTSDDRRLGSSGGVSLSVKAWQQPVSGKFAPGNYVFPEMTDPEVTSKPNTAVIFTGGGTRAMTAAFGQLQGLQQLGVSAHLPGRPNKPRTTCVCS
jgi:hypothetical protein